MFKHSIKVPRHYKVAANIIKKVCTEGGSIKTLLYDDKLRHFKTNVLFALVNEAIRHTEDLDKIFESCSILDKEPRLDPWLAKVLATELLFGKKALPGQSKPEQTILSYKDQFEKYTNEHQADIKIEAVSRPRYVRINTNLLTTSDAIRAFQDEGYRFLRCTSSSYDDYLKQIQNLTEDDFIQDYHIKTIFVFAPGTKLHEHELYLENKIILQDKATAMAVHLLAPPPGSAVLDMCAAPGMKTTQLAASMRNQGKIYAVERNERRYQTLCEFVERTGSTCVETFNKDSLEIKRGDFDDVEYILLDPSCSGSGMELSVHNYIEDTRLAKLTSLQEKFLKHAMNAFPIAKRIVYSTCSLFPEENERVITNVVKASRAKWRVQDVKELLKGQWNNFGSGMYGSMGTKCLYTKPDSDFTIGFFLAVLDRDPKYFEKHQNKEIEQTENEEREEISSANDVHNGSEFINKKSKKRKSSYNNECQLDLNDVEEGRKKKTRKESDNENKNISDVEHIPTTIRTDILGVDEAPQKKKKKRNKAFETEDLKLQATDVVNVEDSFEHESNKKKKRVKGATGDTNQVQLVDQIDEVVKKKKKKHEKRDDIADVFVSDSTNVFSKKKKK